MKYFWKKNIFYTRYYKHNLGLRGAIPDIFGQDLIAHYSIQCISYGIPDTQGAAAYINILQTPQVIWIQILLRPSWVLCSPPQQWQINQNAGQHHSPIHFEGRLVWIKLNHGGDKKNGGDWVSTLIVEFRSLHHDHFVLYINNAEWQWAEFETLENTICFIKLSLCCWQHWCAINFQSKEIEGGFEIGIEQRWGGVLLNLALFATF